MPLPSVDPLEKAAQYGRDVLNGRVVTGELVKLAVKRHYKDLIEGPNRGLFFFARIPPAGL